MYGWYGLYGLFEYGFLSLRFLEKESAKTAAARNPKGDKSGRGLASLRAAGTDLLVEEAMSNLGFTAVGCWTQL